MDNTKRKLKWGWILLLVTLSISPLQMLNLLAQEESKTYWCSADHFSTARCHAAEDAVFGSIWSMVIFGLVMLASIGILLDLFIFPKHDDEHELEAAEAS